MYFSPRTWNLQICVFGYKTLSSSCCLSFCTLVTIPPHFSNFTLQTTTTLKKKTNCAASTSFRPLYINDDPFSLILKTFYTTDDIPEFFEHFFRLFFSNVSAPSKFCNTACSAYELSRAAKKVSRLSWFTPFCLLGCYRHIPVAYWLPLQLCYLLIRLFKFWHTCSLVVTLANHVLAKQPNRSELRECMEERKAVNGC